jgi:hypothetical protein
MPNTANPGDGDSLEAGNTGENTLDGGAQDEEF